MDKILCPKCEERFPDLPAVLLHSRECHPQKRPGMAYCISCNSYVDENHRPHIFNKGYGQKENNMEEQMEQVWRCKDGKGGVFTGSKEEVEAYLKSKNPLAGMQFPYKSANGWAEPSGSTIAITGDEHRAFVAFANLAPLIQELDRHWKNRPYHFVGVEFTAIENLLLAYEEALKQVPQ